VHQPFVKMGYPGNRLIIRIFAKSSPVFAKKTTITQWREIQPGQQSSPHGAIDRQCAMASEKPFLT
jgi:hypothetical protein